MKTNLFQKMLACLLGLCILFSGFPMNTMASDTLPSDAPAQESLPEESTPAESAPVESVPETSEPETSVPGESVPEASEPIASVPEESTPAESIPEESAPEESLPVEPPAAPVSEPHKLAGISGPGLYFGLLHAHTSLSEGTATPEELFQAAVQQDNLDFFAVTDLSDSFDQAGMGALGTDGSTLSSDWATGKAAAAAVTTSTFAGIFGFEMGWPSQMQIGHIATFGTPGFLSWTQEPYRTYNGALKNYYEALAAVPGCVGQFCHPGYQYGTFGNFDYYSEAADRAMALLELDFGSSDPCQYYIRALDRGWHLAPSASQPVYSSTWVDSGIRTAVHAQSLTEAGILDALRNYRAYATEDADLQITYSMDGYPMGSRLDLRHVGDTMELSVTMSDATDTAVGLVEVITTGGSTIAQQTLTAAFGTLTFSLPTQSGYYFLKITQPDGNRAVTAPIWVDAEEHLGITALVCETAVPVQNEEVVLSLELHNGETPDFRVSSLEILADGQPIHTDSTLSSIPGSSTLTHRISFTGNCVGVTEITAKLTGTLEGCPRSYEQTLTLSFHRSQLITAIVADGGHGNAGLDRLNTLKALAAEENIRFSVAETVSAELLKDCRFLLVCAPSRSFSQDFLDVAAQFAQSGGSLVLCGQADSPDAAFSSAAELNRLLQAVGSGIRLNEDLAQDAVTNGGCPEKLYLNRFNSTLSWCNGLSANQVYRVTSGCTLDPGSGTWIVKGHSTTCSSGVDTAPQGDAVLLACESLSGGGTVFAGGSLFVSDDILEEPDNLWDPAYANLTLCRKLLGIGGEPIPLRTIRDARNSAEGELFRIRGYVTAGTSNPHNTFPELLYLQDDTGGIAITPFTEDGIQTGTAVEITGYAQNHGGNRVLKADSWKTLDRAMYLTPPKTGSWKTLLDAAGNGSSLVEVTGQCQEVYCREDGTLAGCLLKDADGNTATVKIEDYIAAGSDGKNDLHKTIRKGRTVQAMGLVHVDDYGDTVVRVRNCEEVVWIPPRTYINPRTGDFLPCAAAAMCSSMMGLILLLKKKNA